MSTFQSPALIAGSRATAQQSPVTAPKSVTLVRPSQTSAQHASSPAAPVAAVQRPPCADMPNDWDLDVGTIDSWRSAVRICRECPLFAECAELAQSLIDRGMAPRSMIWAGVAYDGAGRVVENLDRHRVATIDHKRPLRIIRNGERPLQADSAPTAPQRHLVLGRRLRPTGIAG